MSGIGSGMGNRKGRGGPGISRMLDTELTPKTVVMSLVIFVLLVACFLLYKSSDDVAHPVLEPDIDLDQDLQRKLKRLRASEPDVAILTAYHGDEYEVMGMLSDMTKQKYCDLYGYTLYVDNHLFKQSMNWNQKSAIRTLSIRQHLKNHDWVFWTDSEIFIVNPAKRLSGLIDDKYDVIMSKDWGGRQLNPGSSLFRNSAKAIEILNAWEFYIEDRSHHDDLRAFEDLVRERPDLASRVKWVHQRELNAYPDIELKDKSYVMDLNSGHHYYEDGDLLVHIVNCLRDWGKDRVCCHGMGVYYYYLFDTNYKEFLASL
eukprot:TRINITY_DN1152_c0_g1_i1.p1 TRINITY_DN1152_c0_g1~~TRINITY_DN1152_c0_g1_i1.p1  ORF type:complete len:336 (+),score=52.40 TRINITY_DN1152_c0_g1_i1:62-1009(+)